jgi:hypothetical protein
MFMYTNVCIVRESNPRPLAQQGTFPTTTPNRPLVFNKIFRDLNIHTHIPLALYPQKGS